MNVIKPELFNFLKQLAKNNNRVWFAAHKKEFDKTYSEIKAFFKEVFDKMQETDSLQEFHVHRIYRDLRFSKDKTPFKTYFRLYLGRTKPLLRGGYYLNIEPGNSRVSGGFWDPVSKDILRIRRELAVNDQEFRNIFEDKKIKKYFGELQGEEVKTVPKGFDKDNPAIDLIKKKQFILRRSFTDMEVLQAGFLKEVVDSFRALRPFFDYMSEVLTTDENGVSLYKS